MSHRIDHVLSLAAFPWAMEARALEIIAGVLMRRATAGPHALDADELAALTAGRPARHPAPPPASGVALIPVHGVIAPRITALGDISGGTTFEALGAALAGAVADPAVATIVLDINSPGGSVLGARVFARAVLAARAAKPVIAQVQYQGNSAAYWLAACATEIVAAPGSYVGSIGVYLVHDDVSKFLADAGVVRTLIAAGDGKLDGNENVPLSADARGRLDALVADSFTHFVADVAAGRGRSVDEVRNGFGTGKPGHVRTVDEALGLGMIDRSATLDETLARFGVSAATVLDTPQEPARATGQDRARDHRAFESQLLALW